MSKLGQAQYWLMYFNQPYWPELTRDFSIYTIHLNSQKKCLFSHVRTYESTITCDTILLSLGWRPTNRILALKQKISQAQSSSRVSTCTGPSDRPSMKSFRWLLGLWRRGWRRILSRLAIWKARGLELDTPQRLKATEIRFTIKFYLKQLQILKHYDRMISMIQIIIFNLIRWIEIQCTRFRFQVKRGFKIIFKTFVWIQ